MSKLKKKLSRLTSAGPGPKAKPEEVVADAGSGADVEPPVAGDLSSFRSRLRGLGRGRAGRKRDKPKRKVDLTPLEIGESIDTPYGSIQRTRACFDAEHLHGCEYVAGAKSVSSDAMRRIALDESMSEVDFSRALFLDTETTGLAGGTGTVPFLIGLGFFEDANLVVEQLFLPKLGYEAPMLHYLKKRIEQASVIVSYNGKSYDWPLLRSRCVLNRVEVPALPPHLDLLHGARRVLVDILGDMKLITFEEEVLGFHREGDIPGFMIPETYFQFLKDADTEPVKPILTHNVHDILALAAMMQTLERRISCPEEAGQSKVKLAVAKLQARAADPKSALHFVRELADEGADSDSVLRGAILGATLLKRETDFEGAEALLVRGLDLSGDSSVDSSALPEVHLMLAKLYEHQLSALDVALKHAKASVGAEDDESRKKRLTRISRKIERAREEV